MSGRLPASLAEGIPFMRINPVHMNRSIRNSSMTGEMSIAMVDDVKVTWAGRRIRYLQCHLSSLFCFFLSGWPFGQV